MTELHPAFYDLVPSVATSIHRRYRQWTEREDVLQECYAWAMNRAEHYATLLNEENALQRTINEKRIAWQMRRHAERYARKEKAKKSGYLVGDESFYDTVLLGQLLPHVIASVVDGTVLEQAQNLINDGQPRKPSAPAEGGNLLAILIDIKKAYLRLDVADKDILIKRYHESFTLEQMAEYLGCATSTADRRCQRYPQTTESTRRGESLPVREQQLFDYLKGTHFPDLEKSEGAYDSFDCITAEKSLYIELKCRHTHYPDLLIEEMKYRRLIDQAGPLTPYYINSTPQGVYAFDLSRVPEPSWSERRMPATTEFSDTRKIMKLVGFLHLDYAFAL